jgi:hypothetical protein
VNYEEVLKSLEERSKQLTAELAKAEAAQKEREQAVDLVEVRQAPGRSISEIQDEIKGVREFEHKVRENLQELVKQDKQERDPEKRELPAKLIEEVQHFKEVITPEVNAVHAGVGVAERIPMHVDVPHMAGLALDAVIGAVATLTIAKDAITHIGKEDEKNLAWQNERTQSPPPVGGSKEAVEILPNDIPRRDPPMGEPSKEVNDALRRDPPMGAPSKEPSEISRQDPPVDIRETALAAKHEKNQERLAEQMAEAQNKFDKKYPDKDSQERKDMQVELNKQFALLIKSQEKAQEQERQRLYEDKSKQL